MKMITYRWLLTVIFCPLFMIFQVAAGTATHTYDDSGRLIKINYGDGTITEYTYDTAGNILAKNTTGAPGVTFFRLRIQTDGTGTGTVTSIPGGMDCGSDCTRDFDSGTEVTLSPVPDSGSVFASWSDPGCPGTDTCTVIMDQAHTITATFTKTVDDGDNGSSSDGGLCFIASITGGSIDALGTFFVVLVLFIGTCSRYLKKNT